MSFELVGPAAQVNSIRTMANTLKDALGDRVKPVSVVLKPAAAMPERLDGGRANGFWKPGLRQIWLLEETDDYPVGKTFAHEVMHVVDDDWLTRAQRLQVIALMSPTPTTWRDQNIGGQLHKYVALPYEAFAVYASAAIGGFQRPAYRSLFRRRIAVTDWPTLAQLTLRDDGPMGRGPEVTDPIGSPPDTVEELQEELRDTKAKLAQVQAKLAKARNKAAEITSL